MTFFELTEPSSTKGKVLYERISTVANRLVSEFADLPVPLLKLALQTLIKQNKAQIFSVGDGEGVKFV
jgi:hypothetical protein